MRNISTDKKNLDHVLVSNSKLSGITEQKQFNIRYTKKSFDRRLNDRMIVRDGIYAVIESVSPQICQIKDMGEDGMSFVYFNDGKQIPGSDTVDFLVVGFGFRLEGIPFRVVEDYAVHEYDYTGKLDKRVACVEFVALNENQIDMVRNFLTHFVGKSVN